MNKFYVIKEKATSITMVVSEYLEEIKEIYTNYDRKYFILEDNFGKEVMIMKIKEKIFEKVQVLRERESEE